MSAVTVNPVPSVNMVLLEAKLTTSSDKITPTQQMIASCTGSILTSLFSKATLLLLSLHMVYIFFLLPHGFASHEMVLAVCCLSACLSVASDVHVLWSNDSQFIPLILT